MPHTNISRLCCKDTDATRIKAYKENNFTELWSKLSNMYIDNPYCNYESINDNQDMDEDEDCNIGGEAEETSKCHINKKLITIPPK